MERYYLQQHKDPSDSGVETTREAFLKAAERAGITGRLPARFSGPCGENRVTGWVVAEETETPPVADAAVSELVA